jgi:hypothetical protein
VKRFAFVLAALVAACSVFVGFTTDDFIFLRAMRRPLAQRFDLYNFTFGQPAKVLVHRGILPWWTAPDYKLHFIRPLTSAVFVIDHFLFGKHALGYQLTTLALLGLLWWVLYRLYTQLFEARAALFSTLVYAFAAAHAQAYAYVSARHVVIAALLVSLALLARERRWLAMLLLALGLASSEAALGGLVFLWCFELRRRNVAGGVSYFAYGILYLVFYKWAGGGAQGASFYADPLREPVLFARAAALRVPMLLGDALGSVPTDLHLPGFAALLLAGGAIVYQRPRSDALSWLVPGAIGALAVAASGAPVARMLVVPDIGIAALIGCAMAQPRPLARPLMLLHFLLAPLLALYSIDTFRLREQQTREIARTAEIGDAEAVFLIAASDPYVYLYSRGEMPGERRCWSVLSGAKSSHRLTRTAEDAITLEALDQPLLYNSFDALFRPPREPLLQGQATLQCEALITVTGLDRNLPRKLEIELPPRARLLQWHEGRLRRFELPKVGESVVLQDEPGPTSARP